MSGHVLLNLLNELRKRSLAFFLFFTNGLIDSLIQEHKCQILFIICY